MLKRKQIYLDEESESAIKQLSSSTKISEAEHIRRAVTVYLSKYRRKRHEKDPLLDLIGICDNPKGPTDASLHHDKYLYGKKG
ncbi:MAG: hypothetical protein HY756_04190 [Nitrospirae bacterium]|nr:hypothetical protein [Nitrospirota bacterium]